MSHRHRIRIDQVRSAHGKEDLIDRKRLHDRRVVRGDLANARAPVKQRKISRNTDKIRTFSQRQRHRLPGRDPVLFRRDRFCHDDLEPGPPDAGRCRTGSREDPEVPLSRVLPPPTIKRHCSHPHEISIVLPYCFPQKLSYCLVFSQFLIFRFIPVTLTDDSHVPNVNRTPY